MAWSSGYAGRMTSASTAGREGEEAHPPQTPTSARRSPPARADPTNRPHFLQVLALYDHLTARRDGVASTGNGRRESFRHLPIPRMTNTYIAPGEATPEELIGAVDAGFYAVSFAGGQVDPTTGDFVFGVSEGYLIEGGRVTRPCRGATLIGNCLQALAAIDAVGSDFAMKTGICGKGGQSVAAGVGQPHVRIKALTVGGTG